MFQVVFWSNCKRVFVYENKDFILGNSYFEDGYYGIRYEMQNKVMKNKVMEKSKQRSFIELQLVKGFFGFCQIWWEKIYSVFFVVRCLYVYVNIYVDGCICYSVDCVSIY